MPQNLSPADLAELADQIKIWGRELGFSRVGIAPIDLERAGDHLGRWLAAGHQGAMDYMGAHGEKRYRPELLVPGTQRVICATLDYGPPDLDQATRGLGSPDQAYVSLYARGRDYHKLMRTALQKLARRIEQATGPLGHRAFSDSAPVMEKPLADLAGLGWQGKHTNLLNRQGNWFFLGELFVDLPLPVDVPQNDRCGSCQRCLEACPTRAIIAPYRLDARLCISYLTIEHPGAIPESLRPLMGNRIYGCDDCLLACPWNRFAQAAKVPDFQPRNGLDEARLTELFAWEESEFLKRFEGSPIRRLGHERWLRNLAVALGNGDDRAIPTLLTRADHPSPLVREHVRWALARLRRGSA